MISRLPSPDAVVGRELERLAFDETGEAPALPDDDWDDVTEPDASPWWLEVEQCACSR